MAKKKCADGAIGIRAISEDDWRADADLDTLIQAAEIRKDPKRYAAAQAKAKQRMMSAAGIAADDDNDD